MTANIIYHLFDQFTKYVADCVEERKQKFAEVAVFPCIVEIIKGNVFNNKNPILVGMRVKHGCMRIGTPLCVPDKGFVKIGKVASIMLNSKPVNEAWPETGDVSVKIDGEPTIQVGRQFEENNQICSVISKQSIEALKENFRDDMSKSDWKLVIKLKEVFGIK